MTALELINRSLKLCGVLGEGQTASAEQAEDALSSLNDILDQMNTDGLSVYAEANDAAVTVASQTTYTVGTGGDWPITRPVSISSLYVDWQGVSYPVQEVNQDQWNTLLFKAQPGILPSYFLYVNDYPLGLLSLWPVPMQAIPVALATNTSLPALTLATVLSLAPGYAKYLRFALAVDLAPEYGVASNPVVIKGAQAALADIKRANRVSTLLTYDPAITNNSPYSGGWPYVVAGF